MARGKNKIECDTCKRSFSTKAIRKKNGNNYCYHCFIRKSKCKMPVVNEKIPKSCLPPEPKKRKLKIVPDKKKKVKIDILPNIKGAKEVIISKKAHLYITKEEKNVLYKKFIAQKMSSQDASNKIKIISEKMKDLARKIRIEAKEKKYSIEQMNQMFLEGLAKYSEEGQ